MPSSTSCFAVFVTLSLGTAIACGGAVEPIVSSDAPSGSSGEHATPSAPIEPTVPTVPPASPPTSAVEAPEGTGNTCSSDAECNDDPTISALLGSCWKDKSESTQQGSCICRTGATMQRSGKCGTVAPSCAAQGGTCTSWLACSGREDLAANREASAECGTPPEDVCCIPQAACRKTGITYCYRKGTDAAYVPPCINGWITCSAGDSPDLAL